MTIIQTYLYPNKIEVQISDPGFFSTRNRQVYSKPVIVYQGIDNSIQVVTKNQDQKPVNLTGYQLQVDIQDPGTASTIQSLPVIFSNIQLGRGSFTISKILLDSLTQRFYKLTFRTIDLGTNAETPLYVDDNYGVPLDLEVLPAYYSDTAPSPTVSGIIINGGTI